MDALSYMLQSVRLRSTCYTTVRLRPPWGVQIPRTDAAAFHAVVSGQCWLQLSDADPPVALARGDVVVLPHGQAHTFFDAPGSPVRELSPIAAGAGSASAPHHRAGPPESGTGATTVICGHLWFDDQMANPLVGMLPPLLHFRAAADGRAAGWLEPVLQFVALENGARTPGADAALARLSDVIVIQAIRAHLTQLPPGTDGWLHALADPQLGTALALIHQHLEAPWTVARLADRAGLSRSAFAARFTRLVGKPPLQYLTYWRMQQAQRLLQASNAGIAQIAAQAGYQTEPAFSRAFKHWTGIAPGAYRRRGQVPR
ncbi:MAG: AraC family transcriptional regulator [Streptosporangiaceae bacterium]